MKFKLPTNDIRLNSFRLGFFILITDVFITLAVYQDNVPFLSALFFLNILVYTVFFSILFETNNVFNKVALHKYLKNNKLDRPCRHYGDNFTFALEDYLLYVDFSRRRFFMVDTNGKIVIRPNVSTIFDYFLNLRCLALIEKNVGEQRCKF